MELLETASPGDCSLKDELVVNNTLLFLVLEAIWLVNMGYTTAIKFGCFGDV